MFFTAILYIIGKRGSSLVIGFPVFRQARPDGSSGNKKSTASRKRVSIQNTKEQKIIRLHDWKKSWVP